MQVFLYDAEAAVALWFLETGHELDLSSFGTDKSAPATWTNSPTTCLASREGFSAHAELCCCCQQWLLVFFKPV